MKTPNEIAAEWWAEYSKDKDLNKWDTVDPVKMFMAGYKEGYQLGLMKGSMAMQSLLDDDYHFTPRVNHSKFAEQIIKSEEKK